jgi:hypothetical protein
MSASPGYEFARIYGFPPSDAEELYGMSETELTVYRASLEFNYRYEALQSSQPVEKTNWQGEGF